jgi:outer membrane beta-barrel protein
MKVPALVIVLIALFSLQGIGSAQAADKKKAKADSAPAATPTETTPTMNAEEGEAVDVSKITEKYWAQGKETELGVVQNRKYSSTGRFELTLLGGFISSDPFLSVNHVGGSLGYHFTQYFSAHFIGWKSAVTGSSALNDFNSQVTSGAVVSTNHPKAFYGVQVQQNFLYGKASLLGQLIIYVDLFALGGLGWTDTQSGTYATPFIGLGQKIHLNKFLAIHFDWRLMRYNETILSKKASELGKNLGERANTSDAVTLGLSFFY